MPFRDKLKKVMTDLGINQTALSTMTGIGKSSLSQYLSGKNVPTEERRRDIAIALGLNPGYFEREEEITIPSEGIVKMLPEEAARLMKLSVTTVRKGLQDGVFPWGYGIQTRPNKWTYFINAAKFIEKEMS